MLSKCANPDCSEIFRYLHQGKIFCLAPTPEVEAVTGEFLPQFEERFWLCDECSETMTVIWGRNAGETSASSRTRSEDPVCSERGKICLDERAAACSSNINESRGSMNSERQGRNLCQLQN
jgi:hypothetical protein